MALKMLYIVVNMSIRAIKVESCFLGQHTNRKYRIVRCRDNKGDFFVVEATWSGGWSDIGEEADTIAKARSLAEQFDLYSFTRSK